MKHLLIIGTIFFSLFHEQSCDTLVSEVRRFGKLVETKTPFSSESIAKAEYYTYKNAGFVLVYFKRDGSLYSSTPYIYCEISNQLWKSFINGASYGSWGQAFRQYIERNKCNC